MIDRDMPGAMSINNHNKQSPAPWHRTLGSFYADMTPLILAYNYYTKHLSTKEGNLNYMQTTKTTR